jgi:hypothetical protein
MEDNFLFLPDMRFYENISDDLIIETAAKFDISNESIKIL